MVPLNICFWNAKANSQNKYELSQFLDQHEHDAVILSETHQYTIQKVSRNRVRKTGCMTVK